MSDCENQIKLDANEALMNSRGFYLTYVTPENQLRYVIFGGKLSYVEKIGLLAAAERWVARELEDRTTSEKVKEYPDDDEEPEDFGPTLEDNLDP